MLSPYAPVAQWDATVWTANNCHSCHIAILARLFIVVTGPTQPSVHAGSVNEDQLQLGRQRQVWFIEFKVCTVQAKLWNPSTIACHTRELLQWGSFTKGCFIKCMTLTFFTFTAGQSNLVMAALNHPLLYVRNWDPYLIQCSTGPWMSPLQTWHWSVLPFLWVLEIANYQRIFISKFNNFCMSKIRIYTAMFTNFLCEFVHLSKRYKRESM